MEKTFDSNLETQVTESRREALNNREKSKKERNEKEIAAANNIVNLVCNIFKASDKSKQEKLVWHVRLISGQNSKTNYRKIKCKVCFTESVTTFYGVEDKGSILYSKQYKELLGAIKIVNAIETTEDIFNKSISYFTHMTNFKVSKLSCDSDTVMITLKSDNL